MTPSGSNSPLPAVGRAPVKIPAFPSRHYPYQRAGKPAQPGAGLAQELPDQFDAQPGRVYRFFLGRDPSPVGQGRYNPRNLWNSSTTKGAMHLVQVNNSLGAEIELAAAASNVRRKNGQLITEARALINCGKYGGAERNSDPHIGAVVNELARADAAITLANPVGLCIAGLATPGWQTPDGTDPQTFWTITRGTKEKALRAEYAVPAAKGYTVGDITINGQAIEYGAQIVDFITIKLTGLACRLGQLQVPPIDGCKRLHHGGPTSALASFNPAPLRAAR